jgi:hypothetical protein
MKSTLFPIFIATVAVEASIRGGGRKNRGIKKRGGTSSITGVGRALSKGKGEPKGSKKKVPKGCDAFKVSRLYKEFAFDEHSIGDSFSYPFNVYDMETDEKIGFYFDSSTFIETNELSDTPPEAFEGIYIGAFNFDFDEDLKQYSSQILVQGIFNSGSGMIAITGGLGAYACASGNVHVLIGAITDGTTGAIIGDVLEFLVCNSCS